MKGKTFILTALVFAVQLFLSAGTQSHQEFDKSLFYAALSHKEISRIDQQLNILKNTVLAEREAYEGALLARKAGLLEKPKEKLNLFKSGRKKLETAINKDVSNVELRFLRLIIQENAPKVVNYKKDLSEDRDFLKKNFGSLSPVVKKIVVDYSKNSKVLKPGDF